MCHLLFLGSKNYDACPQLLNPAFFFFQSDLDDSMAPDTGLPTNIASLTSGRIGKPPNPILVQIVSMTEIGHSAFQLLNVRQTRIDRADLAGLIEAGVEDEEESEPIPKYPRSTLSLELTDGSVMMRAMEYKRMPDLELGVTPLGCKVRGPLAIRLYAQAC